MNTRKVKYKPNEFITPCPKCGNNTEFTVYSDYCAEDCCEIWAVCKCGFDPTTEEKGNDILFYTKCYIIAKKKDLAIVWKMCGVVLAMIIVKMQ